MTTTRDILAQINSFFKKFAERFRHFRLKRDYLVFMAFFVLSFIFWLLKSLSKPYDTDIDFAVRFTNKPRGVIFEKQLPSSITLSVHDAGFQLLQNMLTPNIKSLTINLDNVISRKDRKLSNGHYFVLTRDYESQIEHALASTTQLKSIHPDTLHIIFSNQVRKKVPVRLLANVTPGRQRLISGNITFTPDSVSIFGAGRIVDTIEAVYTNYQDFKNLQDTLRRNIGLKDIDGVEIADKRVNVEIPVEMFTEKVLDVPVLAKDFPDSLRLRTFPSNVKISFFVGISHFPSVTEKDFEVFIDYPSVEGKVSGNVPLSYSTDQNWITNVRLIPEKIDYLLELKQ
ncbi:CdaR family protein [Saccharicrinis sp. FJH54]|uniref:CdaR family protein n=1 Tax=Saccharicrinis sp. FJH54 TaxID=3344665 RepID=UPI0035D44FC5